jgi:hypothetical protein
MYFAAKEARYGPYSGEGGKGWTGPADEFFPFSLIYPLTFLKKRPIVDAMVFTADRALKIISLFSPKSPNLARILLSLSLSLSYTHRHLFRG